MNHSRIADLLAPFLAPSDVCHSEPGQRPGEEPAVPAILSSSQLLQISTYIHLLQRWNARINLTAIRNAEEIVTRHFGESLFAARHLFPAGEQPATAAAAERRQNAAHGASRGAESMETKPAPKGRKNPNPAQTEENSQGSTANNQRPFLACPERSEGTSDSPRLADLGSGAGFPGIPIKLWAPHICLTLIESNHKKATFLHEVARALTLTGIDIQNVRAETLPPHTFDVVTLRAVEHLAETLPTATRLLAANARLVLLTTASQLETARSASSNLHWNAPVPVPRSRSRLLLIGFSL